MLTVGQHTLASREAVGTLGSGATPTLGAASSEGMAGTMIARGVIIDESFCSKGRDGSFVVVKKTMDLLVGRLAGIVTRKTQEI